MHPLFKKLEKYGMPSVQNGKGVLNRTCTTQVYIQICIRTETVKRCIFVCAPLEILYMPPVPDGKWVLIRMYTTDLYV
jgi:hypothetical protein